MSRAKHLLESYFKFTGSLPFPKLRIHNIPGNLKKRLNDDPDLSGKLVGYESTGSDIILVFNCPVQPHEVGSALDLSLSDVMVHTAAQQGHAEPQFSKFTVVYLNNEDLRFEEE